MFVILNLCGKISHNKLKILSSIVKSGAYSDFCPIFAPDFVICRSLHPCRASLFFLRKFIYNYNGKEKERTSAA